MADQAHNAANGKADIHDENVFALIIGINEYVLDHHKNLTGAVADADAMEAFIVDKLHASKDRIVTLRNATRQQILDGFEKLVEITEDCAEDPCIIVFYAGHGSRAERPPGWENWAVDTDVVEMLCPSDLGVAIPGEPGEYVNGILDREVGSLLKSLAEKRGNNITLILDCCCSAGINRDESHPSYVARAIDTPPPFSRRSREILETPEEPEDDEHSQPPTRGVRMSSRFGGMFNKSHVLLAACRRDRRAFEQEGHGMFTRAILDFFARKNYRNYSYNSMMDHLQMPSWQTPHCMGANADRPLFNPRGSRTDPSYLPCVRADMDEDNKPIPETLILKAGLAEGVTLGERFAIHARASFEGERQANPCVGYMKTTSVNATLSLLERMPNQPNLAKLPRVFYARKIDWKNDAPVIYCKDVALVKAICGAKTGQLVSARLVNDPTKASLIITCDGEDVYIDRNDPVVNSHLPSRFPATFKRSAPEEIQNAIGAWKHFNFHLNRVGQNEFSQVRMELHHVQPTDGDMEGDDWEPTGANLLQSEPVQLEIPNDDYGLCIGVTLYNDSDMPVYPYLFYFDPTQLTIEPWSLAAQGAGTGAVDPPLLPRSQLALGYGNGGVDPLSFYIEGEQTKDMGFLLLYLSCSPANFYSISRHKSVFDRSPGRRGGEDPSAAEEATKQLEKLTLDSWGVKRATVIQTRKA